MKSLLLNKITWDLTLDTSGNIATTTDPYAMAQDVATACRLFDLELWYDTTKGIPYFDEILGERPPAALVRARLVKAAMSVPGVVSARAYIDKIENRILTGRVQFTDITGLENSVTL